MARLLDDRVALVTGGAAGMGLASCRALAAEGASVVIADKDGPAAARAVDSITALGGKATAYQADVSSLAQLRAMFEFVGRTHGKLNIFFSNAGIGGALGFDVTEEQFDHVFDVNLKSHFFATNYALPLMRPCAPHASIIYMSSVRGLRASETTPLYCMSKAGIVMLARVFARRLGPEGIRANALCPGGVETAFPQTWMGISDTEYQAVLKNAAKGCPLGRVAQPEDVAALVTFLASDQSMYLSGLIVPVDGGSTA